MIILMIISQFLLLYTFLINIIRVIILMIVSQCWLLMIISQFWLAPTKVSDAQPENASPLSTAVMVSVIAGLQQHRNC